MSLAEPIIDDLCERIKQVETELSAFRKTKWLIYSLEHNAWWRPDSMGYTRKRSEAGRYTIEKALAIVQSANLTHDDTAAPNEAMVQDFGHWDLALNKP